MCQVTDFYEYKYSRNNYYINIFIDKECDLGVKLFLMKRVKNKKISKDYKYAYTALKNQIDKNINKRTYVKLRLNKCYIQYLKDLYYDYYGEESSIYIKEIINHLQFFIQEDVANVYKFYDLKENTKINILSKS